jgi:hypothetical protein
MASGAISYADMLRQHEGDLMAANAPTPVAQPVTAPDPYAQLDEYVRAQQQPAPVAAPAPPAPPPPKPAEAPKTRSPRAALNELRAQDVAAANDVGASHLREGEIKAQAAEKRAAKIGESTGTARRYADAAEQTHSDNRVRQERIKQWMDEDMAKLREPITDKRTKGQRMTSVISGIVGAMGAAEGGMGGTGLAAGMQMLNEHVNRSFAEQYEARDQAGKNLEHNQKALDALARDSSNELDAASKLMANEWLVTARELDQIGEEAKAPIERENARRLAAEAYGRGRDILSRNYERQIARAEAARAARLKAASQSPQWENMPPAVLEAMEANGTLPLAGINALNEARKKANDAQGKPAEPGNVAPVGREVANPEVFASIKPEAVQKFREYEDNGRALLSDIAELDGLLQKWGTETNMTSGWLSTDESEKAAVRMNALNRSIQLKLKQRDALGTLDNGSVAFLEGMTGDPNSLFTSGESVRQQLDVVRQGTLSTTEEKAKSLPAPAPAGEAPPAPAAPQRVTMYGPGGMVRQVKPELLEQYRAQGFTTDAPRADAAPATPPPVVDLAGLTPEEYETLSRMGGNY